ncbi:MAG: DUF721 domain-containing protein [Sedimenticola sp.]|nr:DUF721 domain-containing protein [Sedimenticola sp.]
MSKHPRLIADFFRANQTFRDLLKKSAEQALLLQLVRRLVPPPLDTHCVAAVKKGNQLLIYVDSPAWASRLRFTVRQLSAKLAETGEGVQKITVRVVVTSRAERPARGPIRHLSGNNARLLTETAEQLDDAKLSEALRRLAKHAG